MTKYPGSVDEIDDEALDRIYANKGIDMTSVSDSKEALLLAKSYIDYVESKYPSIHAEANGSPPINNIIIREINRNCEERLRGLVSEYFSVICDLVSTLELDDPRRSCSGARQLALNEARSIFDRAQTERLREKMNFIKK